MAKDTKEDKKLRELILRVSADISKMGLTESKTEEIHIRNKKGFPKRNTNLFFAVPKE